MHGTNDQAAVANGVQRFVDNLAQTISETLNTASEKVAMEAAIVRQKYRFDAFQNVLQTVHNQRDQLLASYHGAKDPTTQAIINTQLTLVGQQLQSLLVSAGVPVQAATDAASQAVMIPAPQPKLPALPAPKKARMRRAS